VSYGRLSPEQADAVKAHVEGKVVHDLGAGLCELAVEIARLGAKKVIAVDKEPMPIVDDPRVERRQGYFGCVAADVIDVAFVSWPQNQESIVLLRLLEYAESVVYLGSNTGGNACGWPGLFESFLHRRVAVYVPERPNTLIIYRERLKKPRKLEDAKGEEYTAITLWSQARPVRYEEAEDTRG